MKQAAPLRPFGSRKRKASIEIYFVLYLSAIILLLGTAPSRQNRREEELEELIRHIVVSDFKVKVDKAALLYSFIPAGIRLDTVGTNLMRDSVNVVSAHGSNFSNVDFTIVAIADSATGRSIPLDRATLVRRDDYSAIFQWRPSAADRDGVYRVTVAGIATPTPPRDIRGELREKINDVLKGGTVRDSATFTVHIFAISDPAMLRRMALLQTPSLDRDSGAGGITRIDTLFRTGATGPAGGSGELFALRAAAQVLRQPPGTEWRNSVSLDGLASMDEMEVTATGADARIASKGKSFVDVYGTTPTSGGEVPVVVTAKRRSDGRTITLTFSVRPAPMSAPSLPDAFIAGNPYRLDFSSSGIPDAQIGVEVIENDVTVIDRNQGGATLFYTPSSTGKVRFVRYVGDQAIDRFPRTIGPIPQPQISKPVEEAGESVLINTVAYGSVKGQQNRAQLIVDEGEVDDPELVTSKSNDTDKSLTQTWRLRKRRSGEIIIQCHAVDLRGSKTGRSNTEGRFVIR
jgi:hypothetical protein